MNPDGPERLDLYIPEHRPVDPAPGEIAAGQDEGQGTRHRRLAPVVGALAIAVIAAVLLFFGWRAYRRSGPSEPVSLAPLQTKRTAADEETSPFNGFALTVDTAPPGAVVSIGGKVRGEAPVLANVECTGAEKVVVTAHKEGYRTARREVQCRADLLVKVLLRLER